MATAATYPTGALRDALERTATDPDLPAASKQRELRTIRDELRHLSGYADTLLGELSLAEQRDALDAEDESLRIHEDSAIREEMLRRKMATPEQLDAAGLTSREEVAERRADGTLSEAIHPADWLPSLHPRDRLGRWADAPANPRAETVRPPHTPSEAPSRPPPRPDDPLVLAGVPYDVADGFRDSEPAFISSLERDERAAEERRAAPLLLDNTSLWGELSRRSAARWEGWRNTRDTDQEEWRRPEGLTYSPGVAAITSPADAEGYLATRGVEAHLTPPATPQGDNLALDVDFFRQIAQAVTDAQDRYPQLRDGKHPLKRVVFWSDSKLRERGAWSLTSMQDLVWGTSGLSIDDPDRNPDMSSIPFPDGSPADTPDPADWAGDPVVIVISDIHQFGLQARRPEPNQINSYADYTPYGRMMHELGHAVQAAAGVEDDAIMSGGGPGENEFDWLNEAELGPGLMQDISPYGASSPGEGWAEVFSTLNVPGALDKVRERSPLAAEKAEELRDLAKGKGFGPLL